MSQWGFDFSDLSDRLMDEELQLKITSFAAGRRSCSPSGVMWHIKGTKTFSRPFLYQTSTFVW